MSMYDVERVANGAQLLDERMPGWYRKIDPGTLVMSDSCHCIIGQLSGAEVHEQWVEMIEELSGVSQELDHREWLQFILEYAFGSSGQPEWLQAIEARLALDALPAIRQEELVIA